MDDVKTIRLRKHDFWTSLVLLALASGMAWEATGYPMTDSYGGVRNVWYVSPALFPLLVAAGLFLLSLLLLINSVLSGGARAALAGWGDKTGTTGTAVLGRFAAISALLAAYVYALVPRVDFFIATVLFLQAFIALFHIADRSVRRPCLIVFAASAAGAGALALAGVSDRPLWMALEGVLLIACLWLPWAAWRGGGELAAPLRHAAFTSIAVSAVLTPIFKYALLVPLPAEGIVVQAMDAVRYALRAAGA